MNGEPEKVGTLFGIGVYVDPLCPPDNLDFMGKEQYKHKRNKCLKYLEETVFSQAIYKQEA